MLILKNVNYLFYKNIEFKNLQEKIDNLENEKEKVQIEFDQYKKATHEVGALMEKCEENASIRAEFELAKKVF